MSFSKDNKDQKKNNYYFDNNLHSGTQSAYYEYHDKDYSYMEKLPYATNDKNVAQYEPNAFPFCELKETNDTKAFDDYFNSYKAEQDAKLLAPKNNNVTSTTTSSSSSSSGKQASSSTSSSSSSSMHSSYMSSSAYSSGSSGSNSFSGGSSWSRSNVD
jgi:hypothetical protein